MILHQKLTKEGSQLLKLLANEMNLKRNVGPPKGPRRPWVHLDQLYTTEL